MTLFVEGRWKKIRLISFLFTFSPRCLCGKTKIHPFRGIYLFGNSKIGVRLWKEISKLICLRHLFRSTAARNLKIIFKIEQIFFTRAHRVLS